MLINKLSILIKEQASNWKSEIDPRAYNAFNELSSRNYRLIKTKEK